MILRCTAKLCKLLGVRPDSVESTADRDWYANLLWFDGRKCLLLTHAETLFSVFAADIRKLDITPIGAFAVRRILEALASEGLPATTFGALDEHDVRLAKTASRQVLGCMNDLSWMIECDLRSVGGLAIADLTLVNHRLRRQINSPTGYAYPVDLAAARVGARARHPEWDRPLRFVTDETVNPHSGR